MISLSMIEMLNELSWGGTAKRRAAPSGRPSESQLGCQRLSTRHIERLGRLAFRLGYFKGSSYSNGVDEGLEVEQCYFQPPDGKHLPWLKPEMVSLPEKGIAATTDYVEAIPTEEREKHKVPQGLLKSEKERDYLEMNKHFVGISDSDYSQLINKLVEVGLISLQKHRPKVVNGGFAVPKSDGSQRLIIDARNANKVFIDPPNPGLPKIGDLANLYLARGKILTLAKSDLDNYYHRLRNPEWLTQYFGLPSVTVDNQVGWPVVLSVPMGWSHSVYVSQSLLQSIVRRGGVPYEASLTATPKRYDVGRFRYIAYIDDYCSFGTDKEIVTHFLNQNLINAEASGVPETIQG